jgi:hypothetical protein
VKLYVKIEDICILKCQYISWNSVSIYMMNSNIRVYTEIEF